MMGVLGELAGETAPYKGSWPLNERAALLRLGGQVSPAPIPL